MQKSDANKYVCVSLFYLANHDDYDWKILKQIKFTTRLIDAVRINQILCLADLGGRDRFITLVCEPDECNFSGFCNINGYISFFIGEHSGSHMLESYCRVRDPKGWRNFEEYCHVSRKYLDVTTLATTDAGHGWLVEKDHNKYTHKNVTFIARGTRILKYFNVMIDILLESTFIADLKEEDKKKFNGFLDEIKIPIGSYGKLCEKNKYHRFIKCKRLKENYRKVSYCNFPFELYRIAISKLSI